MSRVPTFADSPVVHLDASTSIEAAILRFKKRVTAAQIFQEVRKRAYYVPRGVKRRRKSKKAAARQARAARRQRGIDTEWKPERAAP